LLAGASESKANKITKPNKTYTVAAKIGQERRGVALPKEEQAEITQRIQSLAAATLDVEPSADLDSGSFECVGKTILWKIEFFDIQLRFSSPNPADEWVTRRVITVMLAEESQINRS
jgi:hypothetical protein